MLVAAGEARINFSDENKAIFMMHDAGLSPSEKLSAEDLCRREDTEKRQTQARISDILSINIYGNSEEEADETPSTYYTNSKYQNNIKCRNNPS